MSRNHHSEVFLEAIKSKFMADEWVSDQDFEALIDLCSHPAKSLRETALTLLLEPPVTQELLLYQNLLGSLTRSYRKIRELPIPLLDLLCEFIAARRKLPQDPPVALFLMRVLGHLPHAIVNNLYEKSFPLEPFLARLRLGSLLIPPRSKGPNLKRRWQLLRKRLLRAPANPSWAQLTFADIAGLLRGKRSSLGPIISSGRWLGQGRPLIFPQSRIFMAPFHLPLSRCIWRGAGPDTLRFLNHLLSRQTEELRSVGSLAQALSQDTRRVVLSWHNATLAAASGWAFKDLRDQFPEKALWEAFTDTVHKRTQDFQRDLQHDRKSLDYLCERWQKRLVIPKILHVLWEDRMLAALDASYEAERQEHLEAAQNLLWLRDLPVSPAHKGFGWMGPISPHQHSSLKEVLDWSKGRQAHWIEGLLRLAVLLQEGQTLLEKGMLSSLVLPWIDKFFISSHREEDWEYLRTLVDWIERHSLRPLILFWEDTPHHQEPSFKLVLQRLCEQGCPYRGIGVFDSQGSSRDDAHAIICNKHRETIFFALRPFSDCHNYQSFMHLIEKRDYGFLKHYDSSWKDGLCFLYAGTQVFPLLSIQSDIESIPAWIAGEGVKYPFGSYLRNKLREAVLGKRPRKGDVLSLQYAIWANLC